MVFYFYKSYKIYCKFKEQIKEFVYKIFLYNKLPFLGLADLSNIKKEIISQKLQSSLTKKEKKLKYLKTVVLNFSLKNVSR